MKDYYGKECGTLKDKKLWLFDMDGTVYLGDKVIGETDKTLDKIRQSGRKIIYLTNNSSKSRKTYALIYF